MGVTEWLFQMIHQSSGKPGPSDSSDPAVLPNLDKHVIGNKYLVQRKLGSGATGCVYCAQDMQLERAVALKIIFEDEGLQANVVSLFLSEGRVLAQIDHPNVVKVYASEIDQKLKFPFLVMEFIEGLTFDKFLKETPCDVSTVIQLFIRILEGIEMCHKKGIVHRDLKPSNILITKDREVKIIDFGVARNPKQDLLTGFALGTPEYMAPEQFVGGNISPKADIYALGIMLWELLTDSLPFTTDPNSDDPFFELSEKHRKNELPMHELENFSRALPFGRILESMLEKDPNVRPEIPVIINNLQKELLTQKGVIGEIYEVEEVLSKRGLEQVFRVRDTVLNRVVVLRMLSKPAKMNSATSEAFLKQREVLASLHHPCIPNVFSVGTDSTTQAPFVAMEFVQGIDLGKKWPELEKNIPRMLNIFCRLASGLDEAHKKGLYHRKLSLNHILLTENDQIKIIGFDLSTQKGRPEEDLKALGSIFMSFVQPFLSPGTPAGGLAKPCPTLEPLLELSKRMIESQSSHLTQFPEIKVALEALLVKFEFHARTAKTSIFQGKSQEEKLHLIRNHLLKPSDSGLEEFAQGLEEESDPAIISAFLVGIAHLGGAGAIAKILPFLRSYDPQVRSNAINALYKIGHHDAWTAIVQLLDDSESRVRHQAATALRSLGLERVQEHLQSLLLFGKTEHQAATILALRFFPTRENQKILEGFLKSDSGELREKARKALEIIGHHLSPRKSRAVTSFLRPPTAEKGHEKHVIICGLGKKGQHLLKSVLAAGRKAVVIETNPTKAVIQLCNEHEVALIAGPGTDATQLLAAGFQEADFIFGITESDDENLEIGMKCQMLMKNGKRKNPQVLRCFLHVSSPQKRQIFYQYENMRGSLIFESQVYDIYETSARNFLHAFPPSSFGLRSQVKGTPLHILLLGFGRFGMNVAIQSARLFQGLDEGKIQITVIDPDASQQATAFRFLHSSIDQIAAWKFIDGDIMQMPRGTLQKISGEPALSAVYVCYEQMTQANRVASFIRGEFGPDRKIPVAVGFPSIETLCRFEAIMEEPLDRMARVLHNYYCSGQTQEIGASKESENVKNWKYLRGDLKESNRFEADHIPIKLCSIALKVDHLRPQEPQHTLSPNEIDLLARLEHRRWIASQLLAGWKYGETKDYLRLLHPDLVPWEKLSTGEKDKNRRAVKAIPALLAFNKQGIYREAERAPLMEKAFGDEKQP